MKKNDTIYFAKGFAIKKSKIIFLLLTILGGVMHYATAQASHQNHYDTCWEGTLGNRIPVLLYYQQAHHLTAGNIVYLNTKAKRPISVIGHLQSEDGGFILNEYDQTGNITGIWTLEPKGDSLVGTWDKPYSDREYAVHLTQKDTLISAPSLAVNPAEIAGDYYYQYGKKGPQGEWKIQRIGRDSIAIDAWMATSAPARNLADITDTVALKENHFIYKVSMDESWMDEPCEIVMKGQFYKDFLRVKYINENPCRSYFGHNATLEGIFYKITHKQN